MSTEVLLTHITVCFLSHLLYTSLVLTVLPHRNGVCIVGVVIKTLGGMVKNFAHMLCTHTVHTPIQCGAVSAPEGGQGSRQQRMLTVN